MSIILQLDGGNSRLKWRLLNGEEIGAQGAERYEALDVEVFVERFLVLSVEFVQLAAVKISPVLNEVVERFRSILGRASVIEVMHAMFDSGKYAYAEFERMGIDRCLAIEGAKLISGAGRACLVLDGGSALTADYIDCDGRHVGGYIFPGVSMLRSSLLSGTSKIYVNEDVDLSYEPGVTTEQCVSHALDVMLKSTLAYLQSSLCLNDEVIYITGGDAVSLGRYLEGRVEIRSDLVFLGMSVVVPKGSDE